MKTLSPERQRDLTLLCVVCALACVVFAGIVGTNSLGQGQQIDENTQDATTAKKDVKVARAKVVGEDSELARTVRRLSRAIRKLDRERREQDALIRDLRAAGAKLPSVVQGDPGPPGLGGARGPRGPGPTALQVQAAVAAYCETHRCGIPPTQQQVNAAVRVCSAAGGCKGERGDTGATGPQGPTGPAGTPGMNGQDGQPGPVVPCPQLDPALRFQCVPVADTPPPPLP